MGVKRAVLILSMLTAQLAMAAGPPRVAIIKSSSLAPFNQAADAIVEVLRNDPLHPEVLTLDLDGNEARTATTTYSSQGSGTISKAPPQLP